MSHDAGYGQFCPVAMAAEVLCRRWTMLIMREILSGSARFNDLRRGLPRMSPALLSRRLRELEQHGLVTRRTAPETGAPSYEPTQAGEELMPVVMAMGHWGQKWLESQLSLKNLDPSLLMWDMRRNLDPTPLPPQRVTVQFRYPEVNPAQRLWWLIVENAIVDLCSVDPGFEIDLYVSADLRTMTAIWMGLTSVRSAVESDKITLVGDRVVADRMQQWLGLSPFARAPAHAATG